MAKHRRSLLALGVVAAALVLVSRGLRDTESPALPPTRSYRTAVAIIAGRQASDARVAVPAAQSILLTHGARTPRAFVLLHGLTDSPRQFAALAQRLYADGGNVFVPRFPRHGLPGADARALGALTASQLRGFADSVVSSAGGLGDSVVVVGLSMGGTVAAWIAQERAVSRAVLIAPALEPGRIPSILDRPIIGLADRLPGITWRSRPDTARPDRELGFSTHAVAEILELGAWVLGRAAQSAPSARQMVFLVNANDRTVRESAEEALAREWARHGAAVSVYELPDSLRLPHNVVDPPRGRVLGPVMFELLRELSYGEQPSMLVHPLRVGHQGRKVDKDRKEQNRRTADRSRGGRGEVWSHAENAENAEGRGRNYSHEMGFCRNDRGMLPLASRAAFLRALRTRGRSQPSPRGWPRHRSGVVYSSRKAWFS